VFRHIRTRFGKLKIGTKMYLILIPVILLLMIVFFVSFQFMLHDLEELTIDKNEQLLSLICNDITSELNMVDNTATIILSNDYVKKFTRSDSGPEERSALQTAMTRLTSMDFGVPPNSNISSFMVVKNRENYVHGQISKTIKADSQKLLVNHIFDYYEQNAFTSNIPLPDDLYAKIRGLCYVLPLAENETYRLGGYLVLIVDRGFLARIVARYYDNDRTVLVSDQTRTIVWGAEGIVLPDAFDSSDQQQLTFRDSKGKEYLFLFHHLDELNWDVSIRIPTSSIRAQLHSYQLLCWGMLLFIFILAVFMVTYLTRSFTRRLSEMAAVITSIRDGELDCRFPVRYEDEISLIGGEFNRMVDQLQNLHIKVAKQQLRQREAELHALQNQINPHFLYNSLDCIRSAALVSNDKIVARQIQSLSNMFRYTVSPNIASEIVTIGAEVDHLYDYLSMLSFRFEDRYEVDLRIDEQLLPLQTLKLILQPVVENAFSHGVKHMASRGSVLITGQLDHDLEQVVFCVEDNGRGIDPQRLAYLQSLLKAHPLSERDEHFMGLVNINDRIRIAYGNQYGVSVESIWNQGTKVTIELPVILPEGSEL